MTTRMTDQQDFDHLMNGNHFVILAEQYNLGVWQRKQLRLYIKLVRHGEQAVTRYQVSKYGVVKNDLFIENFTFLDDAVKKYNEL